MLSQPPAAEVVTSQNDTTVVTTPCTGGCDCHDIYIFPSRHYRCNSPSILEPLRTTMLALPTQDITLSQRQFIYVTRSPSCIDIAPHQPRIYVVHALLSLHPFPGVGMVLSSTPQDFGEISLRLRNNVSLLPSSYSALLIKIRQHFLNSWKIFETNLLALSGDSRFQDVLKVLAIGIQPDTSSTSLSLTSSHPPPLSVFDYQRLCNVLAGYKYAELLVLRENIGCRVLQSAPVSDICLPPSTTSRNTPHVPSLLCHHIPV